MASLNKVILIGHIGQDPEVKNLPSGSQVANFSLATSERRKDGDQTTWHRIVAFDKSAEFASRYLHKGSLVYVEGRIQVRDWTDKEGVKRTSTEIVAYQVTGLSRPEPAEERAPDKDIPF